PFALIAPEESKRRLRGTMGTGGQFPRTPVTTEPGESDQGSEVHSPASPRLPLFQSPPDDLKGVFTRNFRWGSVDVLNPQHCDFAALRTAVLSTHLKVRIVCGFYFVLM